MDMVYGTAEGGYLLTRPLSMQYKLQNGTLSGSADPMAVEYGGHIWMPDPAYSLRDYFSADFCAMFEGIATYQEEEGGSLFEIDGNLITVKSDVLRQAHQLSAPDVRQRRHGHGELPGGGEASELRGGPGHGGFSLSH